MKKITLIIAFICISCTSYSQNELIGGLCEGCEAVFEYSNRALSPTDTLPGFENTEMKLKVTGTIFKADGTTPAEGVILYVYHTNQAGVYPTRGDESGWARRHGYIRGWIKTGADGQYTFYTLKPGSYPSGRAPAHIHPTILEPNGKYYYIAEYLFADDPNLENHNPPNPRGGSGVLQIVKKGDMLVAERDIVLGKNVPDYK